MLCTPGFFSIPSLLFLIAMEALNGVIQLDVSQNTILSFQWPKMDISYNVSFYVEDVLLMLQAFLPNIKVAIDIFNTFEKASELQCKWEGTKATLLSPTLPLPDLSTLNWCWESSLNSTKLLGFHFSDGLNKECMVEKL